jgi:hypothetical protein
MTILSALPKTARWMKLTTVIGSQTITHSLCAEASSRISNTWLPFWLLALSFPSDSLGLTIWDGGGRTLVSNESWDALPLSISSRPSVLGVIDSGLNVSTISSSSHGKFHSSSRSR